MKICRNQSNVFSLLMKFFYHGDKNEINLIHVKVLFEKKMIENHLILKIFFLK